MITSIYGLYVTRKVITYMAYHYTQEAQLLPRDLNDVLC